MSNATKQAESISAKTLDLAPLVELWIKNNPGTKPSHLVRSALKQCKELRSLAGKRYAHILSDSKS